MYILFRLTDSIANAGWLTSQEKSLLSAELANDLHETSTHSFRDAFSDGRVWFACLIYFCAMTGLYGVSFWLPTIIADMGVKQPLHIGALTAVPYVVAAMGMVWVGHSADRHRERRWHVAIPGALGSMGLVLSVLYATQPVLAMAALTLATFGILTTPPLFWSLPTSYLSGAAAAAGIAIINSCGNLAGFISPYIVGSIKDFTGSTAVGMFFVAAFVLLGAVLVIVGVPARLVNR